jgi:hypothetical protein
VIFISINTEQVQLEERLWDDKRCFCARFRNIRIKEVKQLSDWINMKVPDGTDYLEYMFVMGKPTRQQLASMHHVALLVPDIQNALETERERVSDPTSIRSPQVGRNRRWQLNLFDPDGSRAELMEPFTMK